MNAAGQTTIFDQAERAKQLGIEVSWAHADSYWKRAAGEQLQAVIASGREHFTSDDILMPLEQRGIVTGDTRALAALFLAAKRVGLIETTDEFVICRRPSRHHAPIRRWRIVKAQSGAA